MVILLSARKAFLELHESYPKQTWRNRCRIHTANGTLDLSIPVKKPLGNHTKTRDIRTSNHEKWQAMHWRAITSAYGKAPYYMYYKDLLAPFYINKYTGLLWQFNLGLLDAIGKELGIKFSMFPTNDYITKPKGLTDLRGVITPKTSGHGHLLISHWPHYYQVFSDRSGFVEDLSIIDLVFHLGPDSLHYLEEACQYLRVYPIEG